MPEPEGLFLLELLREKGIENLADALFEGAGEDFMEGGGKSSLAAFDEAKVKRTKEGKFGICRRELGMKPR